MGTFDHLQRKSPLASTPAVSAPSFLRPSRPFAPLSPSQQDAPVTQAQPGRAKPLEYSFDRIPIFPPAKKNDTGLPDPLKAGVENLSGMSMDDVQVHYNSSEPAEVQALAYTQGTDIHVGPGQEMHLPHEAWHAVQQMQGRVTPTLRTQGVAMNDAEDLEHEADVMSNLLLRAEISHTSQPPLNMPAELPVDTLHTQNVGSSSLQRVPVVQRMKKEEWEKVRSQRIGTGILERPKALTVLQFLNISANRSRLLNLNGITSTKRLPSLEEVEENIIYRKDYFPEQLHNDIWKLFSEATKKVNIKKSLPVKNITLSYTKAYSGNPQEPTSAMSLKYKTKQISSSDIEMIKLYLERIRDVSIQPYTELFQIFGRPTLEESAEERKREVLAEEPPQETLLEEVSAKDLITALEKYEGQEIRVTPKTLSLSELYEKYHTKLKSEEKRVRASKPMTEQEKKDLQALDSAKLDEGRTQNIDRLYSLDSLAIFLASTVTQGKQIDEENLKKINLGIQTSGTNKELETDTAEKAGKLREKELVVSSLRLVSVKDLQTEFTKYLSIYNQNISSLAQIKVFESATQLKEVFAEAVDLHQQFIKLHPFSNGNGRVARVLFYNFLLAAGIPLFRIDPGSETYKGLSGLHLTGEQNIDVLQAYLLSLHLNELSQSDIEEPKG